MTLPRSLTSIDDLSNEEMLSLLQTAARIKAAPHLYATRCQQKILGMLFFEASTRTYFSFCSAIQRLGGAVLGFPQADNTSIAKGESLADTVRMMAAYADLLVIRHSEEKICQRLCGLVEVPLINAGDGAGEHPSQTLTDLFTIYEHFQRLDVTIGLYGDLKYGRTNHSLLVAGVRLGTRFVCIAPEELQMPADYLAIAQDYHNAITLTTGLTDILPELDVLYVTRLQKERLPAGFEDEALKYQHRVDRHTLDNMRSNSIILHPLPRVNEIHTEVDSDPRAKYFQQAANGVFIRMALILFYLGLGE